MPGSPVPRSAGIVLASSSTAPPGRPARGTPAGRHRPATRPSRLAIVTAQLAPNVTRRCCGARRRARSLHVDRRPRAPDAAHRPPRATSS
jgi:hypothetical protein